jgi:hypothetical protein
MQYILVFFAPFIGPFFRNQPFLGVRHLFFFSILLLVSAGESGLHGAIGIYGLYVLVSGFWQVQCTWNYRKHWMCLHDHIDGR